MTEFLIVRKKRFLNKSFLKTLSLAHPLIVEDFVKNFGKRRKRGLALKISNFKLILMGITEEFGGGFDKEIDDDFRRHRISWFPHLGSRKTSVTQFDNLCFISEESCKSLVKKILQNRASLCIAEQPQ